MVSISLDEIQINLPNGFHDAGIKTIVINYVERTIVLDLKIWVGDPELSDKAARETYVDGVLTISGFDFCVIERPDFQYPYAKGKTIQNRLWSRPTPERLVFRGSAGRRF